MFDEKYIDGTAFVLIMIQMMVYLNCTKHSFVFEGVLFFVLKVGDELESMGFSNIYERKINDLVTGWIKKNGSVEEVLVEINDKEVPINKNQLYEFDTKIIILYHDRLSSQVQHNQRKKLLFSLCCGIIKVKKLKT